METKRCSICKEYKTLDHFRKDRTRIDGFHPWCKECQKEKRRIARNSNDIAKEGERRRHEKYRKGKGRETRLKYDQRPDRKEKQREYQQSEAGRQAQKRAYIKSIESGYSKEYSKRRWNEDPIYKITKLLRGRVRATVTKGCKSAHTLDLLGCTIEELRQHLESQFEPGMSWENLGSWHIDHIVPCSYFDLSDPEQQKICFNFRNLQPLWAKDNIIKSNKLPENYQQIINNIKKELENGNS